MTGKELIAKAQYITDRCKTVYMWGTFGAPLSQDLIVQKAKQYPSRYPAATQNALKTLLGKGCYAFDCVGLIKGILWGWDDSKAKVYGGAVYASGGVPDTGANGFISLCREVSTDFSRIVPGEAVWMDGHIGIYIGGGKVIEASPAWANGVQITACLNTGAVSGLNGRRWTKHGRIPYVNYEEEKPVRYALEIPAQTCYFNSGQEARAAAAVIAGIRDRSGSALKAVAETK